MTARPVSVKKRNVLAIKAAGAKMALTVFTATSLAIAIGVFHVRRARQVRVLPDPHYCIGIGGQKSEFSVFTRASEKFPLGAHVVNRGGSFKSDTVGNRHRE